jgi:hypothetical protein
MQSLTVIPSRKQRRAFERALRYGYIEPRSESYVRALTLCFSEVKSRVRRPDLLLADHGK